MEMLVTWYDLHIVHKSNYYSTPCACSNKQKLLTRKSICNTLTLKTTNTGVNKRKDVPWGLKV